MKTIALLLIAFLTGCIEDATRRYSDISYTVGDSTFYGFTTITGRPGGGGISVIKYYTNDSLLIKRLPKNTIMLELKKYE